VLPDGRGGLTDLPSFCKLLWATKQDKAALLCAYANLCIRSIGRALPSPSLCVTSIAPCNRQQRQRRQQQRAHHTECALASHELDEGEMRLLNFTSQSIRGPLTLLVSVSAVLPPMASWVFLFPAARKGSRTILLNFYFCIRFDRLSDPQARRHTQTHSLSQAKASPRQDSSATEQPLDTHRVTSQRKTHVCTPSGIKVRDSLPHLISTRATARQVSQ